jgi:hypothetical protein
MVAVAVALFSVLVGVPKNPSSVESIQLKLQAELPPGSTTQAVDAWFDRHHIEHNSIHNHLEYESDLQWSHRSREEIGGLSRGVLPDISRGFLSRFDAQIFVFFDHKHKTIDVVVLEIGRGPFYEL